MSILEKIMPDLKCIKSGIYLVNLLYNIIVGRIKIAAA